MDIHSKGIYDSFMENIPAFEKMQEIVLNNIKRVLDENNLYVTAVEARVKKPKSLEGKLELKGHKYTNIYDITDLLGARIIAFYTDEVDKVSSLIEQTFIVDWENSVDKRKIMETDKFGYASLHYICQIPKELYYDLDCPQINNFKFEIQMRTALQHVWATAYHDTGYKSDIEVPKEYIRKMNRLAGILETADEQFNDIIKEISDYRRRVSSLVKNGKLDDLALNGDTFKSYLNIKPFRNLNKKIASINRAEIQETSYMPFLPILQNFDFKTIGDVDRFIHDNCADAYRLALVQIGGTDLDILSSSIGIQNLCIVYMIKKGYGTIDIFNFLNTIFGEKERNLKSAQRIIKQAASINIVPEIQEKDND